MSIPVRSLPARVSPERLVLAAFVCLLVVAAGLRFYDLPGHSVWYDEAVAANNSSGTLSEVIPNTRHRNSSPILYPLALWAVQKVDVSAFSIRILPATASVLTVAALLFLLPRAGVNRWGRVSGGSAGDSFGCRNRARPGCARILHRRAACRADDSGAAGVSAGRQEVPALRFTVPRAPCSSTAWFCSASPSLAPLWFCLPRLWGHRKRTRT